MVAVEACEHLPVVVSVAQSSLEAAVQILSLFMETLSCLQLCHVRNAKGVCKVASLLV